MPCSDEMEDRQCNLQEVLGIQAWCTRESCIYFRLLEPQDINLGEDETCGLLHNGLLNTLSPEMAEWLVEIKERLENTSPQAAKSRITFHRRSKE